MFPFPQKVDYWLINSRRITVCFFVPDTQFMSNPSFAKPTTKKKSAYDFSIYHLLQKSKIAHDYTKYLESVICF